MGHDPRPVTLEVRRHAYTKKPTERRGHGSHLSRAGVQLARRLGTSMGPFDYVLASNVPRTIETALAMGFAVDDAVDMGADLWEAATREKGERHAQWDWGGEAFVRYAEIVSADGPTSALARYQVQLWRDVLVHVPPGGSGLVVAHGGLIEPGLVALCPDAEPRTWGAAFAHGEGARLRFDVSGTVHVQLVRLAG